MERNKFYVIYKLTAPNGHFYIGQTSDIKVRFSQYRNMQDNHQPKLLNSIKKYGWESFKVELLYNGVCSKLEIDMLEEDFINKNWGDSILNLSKHANGFLHLSGKDNPVSKCVYQYSKQGDLIKKWECCLDITKTTGLLNSYISQRCCNKNHFAYNYFWFYEEDNNSDYVINFINTYCKKPPRNSKKVVQLTAKGDFIQEWESCTKAANYYNVKPSSISASTLELKYLCKGYKWVKKQDYESGNYHILDCIHSGIPIKAINIETGEEYIFRSRKEASEKLKIDKTSISKILTKKILKPRKYEFEYYKGK